MYIYLDIKIFYTYIKSLKKNILFMIMCLRSIYIIYIKLLFDE